MAIIGAQFDKMRVTPILDASSLVGLAGTSVLRFWGMNLSYSGLTVSISPGACMIHGRYIRIDSTMTISVPANYTGWFVLTVDLTKSNDSTGNPVYDNYSVTNNQVYLRYILDGDRRYEDLNWGGKVYDLSLVYFVSNGTAIQTFDTSVGLFSGFANQADIRTKTVANDRVYEKIALNNATVGNKYSNCNITLRRHGRICFAKINFRPVTTLAWEQLLDINGFPGYRPDGGDYGGILNEMSYNTEPGGAYIAGTTLRVMHIGRTDVGATTYSGVVTYMTNDDYPDARDIVSGFTKVNN